MRSKAKHRAKKIMRSKKLDTQIHRKEIEMFFHKLQQVVKESRNDDQIPQDCTLLYTNSKKQELPEKNSTFVHTNIRNEDLAYNNYTCRCKHLLEIPLNMFPPFYKKIHSFIGQYEVELNFIQAIVWLKSVTACIPQISVEKLQQLFDMQCNMRDNKNYGENRLKEELESPLTFVKKTSLIHEMFNNSEEFITSSFKNIFDSSCNVISPMIHKSYTDLEDIQNEAFSFAFSLKNQNESVAELSKPETSTNYIMKNQEKKKKLLSKPYTISNLDTDFLPNLNELFKESNDMQEYQNFEGNEQISSKNSIKQINNEIIEGKSICSTSKNNVNILNKHKSVSLAKCQSIESIFNSKYNFDDEYITPTISQHDVIGKIKTPDYRSTNFTNYLSNINFSQIISPVSCMTPREQNNTNNFQNKQVQSETLHDYNNDNFEYKIDDNNLCTSMNDVEKQSHDSAYSTWKIETLNYDTVIITKPVTVNKRLSDANIGHHYNLRSRKKHEELTVSPSLTRKPICRKRLIAKKRSSSKKHKPAKESTKDLSKKKKEDKDEVISANWLDFTIELLNSEYVILTSVKVILSTLCDKRTAQEYAIHRCWKDSLEEQAINAVLNIVDILRMEKKPDICAKEIEKIIVKTLDEMMTSLQLNETFIWIYRIQIILKFCNLLSICVKTINYLIAMLETLQYVLIDAANGNERTTEIEINQLHLVSYTLDMALRTYRILVPRDKKSQPAENTIPYVADLWKMRYRIENEKLEDANFDLDATEKQWINVLQKFTVASVKHLVQFTDVSFSLYHILISA